MKRFIAFANLILFAAALLVSVQRAVAASTNLVANPSVETAASGGKTPTSWTNGKWGTNTTTFTYATTGHTGSKSLTVNMTKYTSGDAKWYFTDVAVTPNTAYSYSEFYKSTVATEIDAQYTSTTGVLSYAVLSSPAASTTAWQQVNSTFTTPTDVKTLTIFHAINKVGTLQTDDFSLLAGSGVVTPPVTPTAPVVTLTSPVANATVSGTVALSANATDATAVAGVQFAVDGVASGAEDTAAPYSVNLDTKTLANGTHTVTATARNTSALTAVATETVNVQNVAAPTAPTVSITAPAINATVSGTTTVTATATDAVGVTSVQFKLDGTNLGNAATTAPYSTSWNTTTASNGLHTLTAVATNAAALSTTSTSVSVSVNNVVVTPPTPPTPPAGNNGPNLILNPSVETATNATTPANWIASSWGTNTSTFSYLATGHTGGHSLKVQATAFTDGAANWYYADVPVTAGTTYQYTNWYQSNVDTEVDAEVTMTDGTTQYFYLGTVLASTSWAQFKTTFTTPAGAKSMAIYQILAKVGYITTDDYTLNTYTPVPFNRAIVSVTFDDGWANQYANARPVMQQNGLIGTYYIISGSLTDQPDYMSATQVKQLFNDGNEIGSHSVTHPDLTTLTAAKLKNEMANSQTTLQNLLGTPVTDFAYPFGAYNGNTIAVGKQYYASQRTVNAGYNTKDNLDLTQLKMYEVDSDISQAQVKAWIDGAIATHSWLILCYHEVATTPSDPTDELYDTQPSDLAAEMAYLKSTGVATETVHQAISEVVPQL